MYYIVLSERLVRFVLDVVCNGPFTRYVCTVVYLFAVRSFPSCNIPCDYVDTLSSSYV
jgi:hypothetical protein